MNKKQMIATLTAALAMVTAWNVKSPTVKEIPVVDYTSTTPEGVNDSRFAKAQWISLWSVWDDAYGSGEIKLRPDWSEQLDIYAKNIMAQPKGKRVMFEWHIADSKWVNPEFNLIHHPQNACLNKDGQPTMYTDFNHRERPLICPWFEGGVQASYAKWKFLMTELKKRGTEIDYFSTENEQGFTPWAFVPGQAEAIDADPRSKDLKALLSISSFAEAMNFFNHREDFIKMNEYFNYLAYKAFVDGMYKPILEIYPKIQISDYAKMYIDPKYNVLETNGWPMSNRYLKTKDMVSNGTDLFYLSGGAFLSSQHGNAETGPLENTPWNAFKMSLNQARAILLSSPKKPFWPTIAQQSWITWSTEQLYREHLIHLSLMATGFVFWGPTPTQTDYKIFSDVLAEVDLLLSWSDRKPQITELIPWQANEVKTCGLANKTKVCRVTREDGTGFWQQ